MKFLNLKHIKTDSEFIHYQVLRILLFAIVAVIVITYACLNLTSPYGATARVFSIIGLALPFVLGIVVKLVEIHQQLKSPQLLHTKRIAATDERRRARYQQALSYIGVLAIFILSAIVLYSLNQETFTIPVIYMVWLLMAIVGFLTYWMRK